jgi:cobalt-zinc-cadmium efflux system outer membrane protein
MESLMNKRIWYLLVLPVLFIPMVLHAQVPGGEPLTLSRVIDLAGKTAPEVRIAATRIAEEEGRLAGAQVRSLENPRLEAALGPRIGPTTTVDVDVGVEIPFERGGKMDHRVAVARAGILREKHAVEDARRQAIALAVGAYYRVLQADERLRLAEERKALAEELFRVARERHQGGDVPLFDVNLARAELSRAESSIASEGGRVARARAVLAASLGLPSGGDLRVEGDLKDRSFFDTIPSGISLEKRSDLLAALAEEDASRAGIALAEAQAKPDIAFRVGYRHEGGNDIFLGGVSVPIPFFNPGKAPVQEARARSDRARVTAEARKTAISSEIEGARRAYAAAGESVALLEKDGLPRQQENEELASESYRAGKINLSILLQVRRDALDTRREYLERLLEAAEAGVELAAAVGALPPSH